ncbi:MAG: glycosyltransferase family 117 protein, partial [Bacteroidales bacterium]
MRNYKLLNNLLGWITFATAAIVYLMTMEPTTSFWDCGEFITSAYKLEVGHPPGAPFFMITGRIFATLASDPSQVALMVNAMSALFSALTILFLFWSITHLAKKLVCEEDSKEMTLSQTISILGSGLVGALVYTFSDTFWFSAVEGEVYAYSSLFTAAVFWLILKWEERADEPHSDR